MLRALLLLGALCLSLLACEERPPSVDSRPTSSTDSSQTAAIRLLEGQPITLFISSSQALLRSQPQADAPVIKELRQGDSLLFSNAVSQEQSPLKVAGLRLEQPWLRVALPGSEMAWLHGSQVRFETAAHPELAALLYDGRIQQLFGTRLYRKLQRYRRELAELRSLIAFEMLYQEGQELRDSLFLQIENRLGGRSLSDPLPDFHWLDGEIPGFRLRLVPDSVQPYRLYEDFAYWYTKAQATPDADDDAFVRIFTTAYPDSVAHFYGSWQKQLGTDSLCSLLGKGQHLAIALRMDEAPPLPDYLQKKVNELQVRLLDDVSLSKNYWMSSEEAVAELEELLALPDTVLQRSVRIELSGRKALLAEPEKYGIRMNAGLRDSSTVTSTPQ